MIRIGIDVGGTNTDAVMIDGTDVLGAVKSPTTDDVTSGIGRALRELVAANSEHAAEVGAVMIGTTHFVNAVVQRRHLNRAAALELLAGLRQFASYGRLAGRFGGIGGRRCLPGRGRARV